MAREETKARGVEGLPGEASVVNDGQRWRWFHVAAVLVAAHPLFFSSSFFSVFSSHFCFPSLFLALFFFSFLLSPSFLSSLFVFSPLCSHFCSLRLPCIYRKKQGRHMDGAATVQLPHDCLRRHVSSISPTRGRPRVSLASGCPWSASFWAF